MNYYLIASWPCVEVYIPVYLITRDITKFSTSVVYYLMTLIMCVYCLLGATLLHIACAKGYDNIIK